MLKKDEDKLFLILDKLKNDVLIDLEKIKTNFCQANLEHSKDISIALENSNTIIAFLKLLQEENIFTPYEEDCKGPLLINLINTCTKAFHNCIKSFSDEVAIAVRKISILCFLMN